MDGAYRVDAAAGIQEQVSFSDIDGTPIFLCRHSPVARAVATALLCHPIDALFHLSYRKLVLAARFLAMRGIEVQRFHYRGTGNSFGNPEDAAFESLVDDALLAAQVARSATGVETVACVGAGWGALVAAAAASRLSCSGLVLWQPVTDPMRYYRQATLAAVSHNAVASWTSSSRRGVLEELESNGWVDIVGTTVYRRLYETSKGRTLVHELGHAAQPVLLIEPAGNHNRRKEYHALVDALLTEGFTVDRAAIGPHDVEWFHGQYGHTQTETAAEVAKRIQTWLVPEVSA